MLSLRDDEVGAVKRALEPPAACRIADFVDESETIRNEYVLSVVPEILPHSAIAKTLIKGELGIRINAEIETEEEPTGSFEPRPEFG